MAQVSTRFSSISKQCYAYQQNCYFAGVAQVSAHFRSIMNVMQIIFAGVAQVSQLTS